MRTSRPQHHAPRPLLSSTSSSSKQNRGKGRNTSNANVDGGKAVKTGKVKLKQAERRLEDARNAVRQSDAASTAQARKGKGKGKQRAASDEEDLEGNGSEGSIPDNTMDISSIKFKMGVQSDDEGDAGVDDEDDEEIDSDLALTEGEEEPPKKIKRQASLHHPLHTRSTPAYIRHILSRSHPTSIRPILWMILTSTRMLHHPRVLADNASSILMTQTTTRKRTTRYTWTCLRCSTGRSLLLPRKSR